MKKIISLIASLSMAATMFTAFSSVASATIANSTPVYNTEVTPLTADEYANDWIGEALPDGQHAFLIEVSVSGLDLSVKASGTTAASKKKRTGTLVAGAGYKAMFGNITNVKGVTYIDGWAAGSSEDLKLYVEAAPGSTPAMYPTTTDANQTEVKATNIDICQYVVTTDATVTYTPQATFKISEIDADKVTNTKSYQPADLTYTVNGEATDSNVVTLKVDAGSGDEGDGDSDAFTPTIGAGTEVKDASDKVIGVVWRGCKLEHFDTAANKYFAEFTSTEVPTGRKTELKGLAGFETDGSVEFDAVMYFSGDPKTNVGFTVTENPIAAD